MDDLTLTHHTGGIEVQGQTQAGEEFVDAYDGYIEQVIDSGRIVVVAKEVPNVIEAARDASLTISTEL